MIDLDQIRTRADLVAIARGYGVRLRKMGFQWGAPCPFHKEKTPSFFIHPGKQLYKCWGCQAEGDVFRFVQRMESLPGFRETAQRVAELAGVPLTDEPWTPEQKQDYGRRREYARTIAAEAQQFWITVRLHVARRQVEAYQVERQACRWAAKHLDDSEDDPRWEMVWLICECAAACAERLEEQLQKLDRAEPESLVSIYLERRSPALVALIDAHRERDMRFAAIIISMLEASITADEKDAGRKTSGETPGITAAE